MEYEILDQYGEWWGDFETYEDAYDELMELRAGYNGFTFKIYHGGEIAVRNYRQLTKNHYAYSQGHGFWFVKFFTNGHG